MWLTLHWFLYLIFKEKLWLLWCQTTRLRLKQYGQKLPWRLYCNYGRLEVKKLPKQAYWFYALSPIFWLKEMNLTLRFKDICKWCIVCLAWVSKPFLFSQLLSYVATYSSSAFSQVLTAWNLLFLSTLSMKQLHRPCLKV